MPPRVSTTTRKQIASLAADGCSNVEIARELGVDRRTAALYGRADAKPTPTPRELHPKLQFLVDQVSHAYCPACNATMYFFVRATSVECPDCRESWTPDHSVTARDRVAHDPT